jgi:hypothetical protein
LNTYGCSRCAREIERIPWGPQEALLVEHPGQEAAQLVLVDQRQQTAPVDARHERIRDVGEEVAVANSRSLRIGSRPFQRAIARHSRCLSSLIPATPSSPHR